MAPTPPANRRTGALGVVSYCKKGHESDVYLYRGLGPDAPPAVLVRSQADAEAMSGYSTVLICHECLLMPALTREDREWDREHYQTASMAEMVAHLERHVSLGHRVPQAAIDRLRSELTAGAAK